MQTIEPGRAAHTACESVPEALFERLLCSSGSPALGRLRALCSRVGPAGLSRLDAVALRREALLTTAQAARLEAAFALGRWAERARQPRRPSLCTPAEVARWMAPELRGLERETFHALLLDTKHRLLTSTRISEGTLTSSLVHPREVFRPAIRCGAAALVVVHNHPSGDPEPSAEDRAVTLRLLEAGRVVGIPLLDHVVLGDGNWVSLRERIDFGSGKEL